MTYLYYQLYYEFTSSTCYLGEGGYLGTEFYLMFAENAPDEGPVKIAISTPRSADVIVIISSHQGFSPAINNSVTISKGQATVVELPPEIRLDSNSIMEKGISVVSTDIISVSALNFGSAVGGRCSGYLAIPAVNMGTDYVAMTWESSGKKTLLAIMATEDDTTVTITLPYGMKNSVTVSGTKYFAGDTIELFMATLDTIRLRLSKGDLTGTRIISNNRIAVSSGNQNAAIGSDLIIDHTMSYLTAVDKWGFTFLAIGIPNSLTGYYLKMTTIYDNTEVTINGGSVTLLNSGDVEIVEVSDNTATWIESSNKLMVIQYSKSPSVAEDPVAPASILLPPVEQYRTDYFFYAIEPPGDNILIYLMIAAREADITKFLLDGISVSGSSGWEEVTSSSTAMMWRYITLTAGEHRLRAFSASPFVAYIFAVSDTSAYGFPVGMNVMDISEVSVYIITPLDNILYYFLQFYLYCSNMTDTYCK